jgi:sugar diacid utilization regulator
VASAVRSLGPVASWSRLGVYRVLAHVPPDDLSRDVLPPGLLTLFDRPDAALLVGTLERFLDHAGDVKATVNDLAIHRGTLYYRLRKIQ